MQRGWALLLPLHLPLVGRCPLSLEGHLRRHHYSAPVDIEEFYDEDERRRSSANLSWALNADKYGVRHELNWVEDTGELYVMREPYPVSGPILRRNPRIGLHREDETEVEGMTVSVVGWCRTRRTRTSRGRVGGRHG